MVHSVLFDPAEGNTLMDQLKSQLRLALTWNRSDIAEDKIFTGTSEVQWKTGVCGFMC